MPPKYTAVIPVMTDATGSGVNTAYINFASGFNNSDINVVLLPVNSKPKETDSVSDFIRRLMGFNCPTILLPGGPDIHPMLYGEEVKESDSTCLERDLFELRLVEESPVPIFGICRGFQVAGVAFGNKLTQHIAGHRQGAQRGYTSHYVYRPTSLIKDNYIDDLFMCLEDRSLTAAKDNLYSYFSFRTKSSALDTPKWAVNSHHHQAFKTEQFNGKVIVQANEIVEAGCWKNKNHQPIVGVQWHPEEKMLDWYEPLGSSLYMLTLTRRLSGQSA